MHRLHLVLSSFLALAISSIASADLIFHEGMGTAPSTTTIATHETANGFDNDPFTMSGTADLRNTSASSGYANASGLANVFFTNSGTANFQIAGIDTSAYDPSAFTLSFGAFKSTTASDFTELAVAYSTDGTTYSPLTFAAQPTGTGTANTWRLITIASAPIPATSNLRLRWTNTSTTPQFRLDDIRLEGTLAAVPEASVVIFGTMLTLVLSGGAICRNKLQAVKAGEQTT